MILHMGGDAVVPAKDIVMILDMATLSAKATRLYVEKSKEDGRFIELEKGESKSLIITNDAVGGTVYASPISAATLHKRCENTQLKDRYDQ